MKKVMVVIAVVLAFSGGAVLGALTPARAEQQQPCKFTQGALAMSIATLIWGPGAPDTAPEAIDKLSGAGIKPVAGWGKPEDCATETLQAEVQEAATRLLQGTVEDVKTLVERAGQSILGTDKGSTTSESGL